MFAVTAGVGTEKLEKEFVSNLDDYNNIMMKALADRLAEGFAEELHERVRKELWGYSKQEHLTASELHSIKYDGKILDFGSTPVNVFFSNSNFHILQEIAILMNSKDYLI